MTKVRLILFNLLLLTLLGLGHETLSEVALGAVAQWGSHNYDALLILPPSYPPRQQLAAFIMDKQGSLPFQVGRVVGSTVTILQGITEIADGTGRVRLGVLACAANSGAAGCVVGGVVAVSGVVEGVHGAVVAANGVRGLVESSGQLLKMAGKGGGGNLPPKVLEQINNKGLPQSGETPFVPKLITNKAGQKIMQTAEIRYGPKAGKRGFLDQNGRIWVKDEAHAGYPEHWDVQLAEGRDYFRVGLDGNPVIKE